MTENLELREWIAVNVMGREHFHTTNKDVVLGHVGGQMVKCPPYELTWNDAALVVERMRELGWRAELLDDNGVDWRASFYHMPTDRSEFAHDPAAPLAICLAAKAAIEAIK